MDLIMSWPEAVAPLATGRAQAENAVRLLKRYGNEAQIARGQLIYAKAKSDSDAVIAGLITALATRDAPGSLPFLQAKLTSSAAGLEEFCNLVNDIISNITPTGQKDVWSTLAKITNFGPLMKALSDGIATIYNNYRSDHALIRKSIQTQLEAARWPDFAKVEPER
jgi:hypothetical protein